MLTMALFEPVLDPLPESIRDHGLVEEKSKDKWFKVADFNFKGQEANELGSLAKLKDDLSKSRPELLQETPGDSVDRFLLKFLRAGVYDPELTFKILVGYVDKIRDSPLRFAMAFKPFEEIKSTLGANIQTIMPTR